MVHWEILLTADKLGEHLLHYEWVRLDPHCCMPDNDSHLPSSLWARPPRPLQRLEKLDTPFLSLPCCHSMGVWCDLIPARGVTELPEDWWEVIVSPLLLLLDNIMWRYDVWNCFRPFTQVQDKGHRIHLQPCCHWVSGLTRESPMDIFFIHKWNQSQLFKSFLLDILFFAAEDTLQFLL